jgi:hypothetical protein
MDRGRIRSNDLAGRGLRIGAARHACGSGLLARWNDRFSSDNAGGPRCGVNLTAAMRIRFTGTDG